MKDEEGGSNQAGTQDYQPYPRMSAEESSQQYTKSWTPFSQYFGAFSWAISKQMFFLMFGN